MKKERLWGRKKESPAPERDRYISHITRGMQIAYNRGGIGVGTKKAERNKRDHDAKAKRGRAQEGKTKRRRPESSCGGATIRDSIWWGEGGTKTKRIMQGGGPRGEGGGGGTGGGARGYAGRPLK